jgi:allophanate hydrolase
MSAPLDKGTSLAVAALLDGYRQQRFTPADVIDLVNARIEAGRERHIWISRLSPQQLRGYLDALERHDPHQLPLYGIPFAIKDNIDLEGLPTTAACPDYAYQPHSHAFVVQRLIEAGAIPVGKTNLDQFATGLVGTRSPYGACENAFNPDYIAGGSSSGSAVSVALGQVSFALGTDTAGSGRVPAAFNNLIGVKPTRGLLSTGGVVPACRTLDCVSVFALDCQDARQVLEVCTGFDREDPFARAAPPVVPGFDVERFRFAVPAAEQLRFFGNREAEALYWRAVDHLESLGGQRVEFDFTPFQAAARLLYEGAWLAERYATVEPFIVAHAQSMHPVTRDVISGGALKSAVSAFRDRYRLQELRRDSQAAWSQADLLLTPTAATLYRISEVTANPVELNSRLGYYTNFMNLLDLCGVAVPAGFQADGLPFGVTLVGRAFADPSLLALAERLHGATALAQGATGHPPADPCAAPQPASGYLPIAVCGAHLQGLPLNPQLTERGAWLMQRTSTAARYRLYALAGGPPRRPGLVRERDGSAIEVEVWAVPRDQVGGFLELIPAPLGLGKVELQDGRWVTGFICEPHALGDAADVTHWGGWRAYLAAGGGA